MPIPQLKPKSRFDKTWREDWHLKKKKKRKEWWEHLMSRWVPILVILVIGGGIFMLGVFAWFSRDLPDPDKLIERSIAQSTKIYARDETTLLYEVHGEQKRTAVNLEDISGYARWATIAVEDKNFYEHKGFSLPRIFKALFTDVVQRRKAQGASTITQQFVKNAILTNEKSWTRKIKELVLAYQIERKFSKDEILKMYFNEIPYGSNIYGIEAASQSFFAKNAKDLTIEEGALLAAIPRATTYYSPYGSYTDVLVARQQMIIDLMAEQEHITQEEAMAAKKIDILSRVKPHRENILAPHFVMYVREILAEKYGDKQVESGGLKVVTTLDYDLQKIAEEEVENGIDKIERYGGSNAALVALDVKTGEILAMVGSKDYFNKDIDGNVNVTTRPRQPGSSFKPIVYSTAFKEGYTPETMLFDLVTTFKTDTKDYIPKNYDLTEHGPVTMRQALQASLNIPAVKTLYLTGVENVLDLAEEMGYTTFQDRSRFGLSLVLGGGEVKLLEHVSAFATLAREGEKIPHYPILRIEDSKGKILEKHEEPKRQRVLDKEIARQMNKVLSDNGTRSSFWGYTNLSLGGRPVAAKTGTTNDYRDAWTLGYTPSLAAGVWTGNNDNTEMKRGAAGLVLATPIWHNFMERALEGKDIEYFPNFEHINTDKPVLTGKLEGDVPIKVDKVTGKKIPDSCLSDWPEEFIEEKTLKEVHNILHYVIKDDPRGGLPSNPESDYQYKTWEEPVQKWARDNNYLSQSPEEEDCSLRAKKNLPRISITAPKNNDTVTQSLLKISVNTSGQNKIEKVEYYVDDEFIRETLTSPFSISYKLNRLENGPHILKAVVYDELENTNQASISFNLAIGVSSPTLYFITPAQNSTHAVGDFPLNIQIYANDPKGVKEVTFYYQKSGGKKVIIDTIANPPKKTLNTTWSSATKGDYKLFLVMENKKGGTNQSDYLSITVK